MKILLTGGDGQIARSIVDAAQGTAHIGAYSQESLDITDERSIAKVFATFKPDVLINCAGYTNVDQAQDERAQAYLINATAVGLLAKACQAADIPLMHLSTDYIFDGSKRAPYLPQDEPAPLNVYGESKLDGERQLATFCQKHIVIRTSWVFSQYGNNFVKKMLTLLSEREAVHVVDDQWGSPTFAHDLAKVMLVLAKEIVKPSFNAWGLYHYAGSEVTTWYGFSEVILQIAQKINPAIAAKLYPQTTEAYKTKARRPLYSFLDSSGCEQQFNVSSSSWRQALQTLIPLLVHPY